MLRRLSPELMLLLLLLILFFITFSLFSLLWGVLDLPYCCTDSTSEVVFRRNVSVVVIPWRTILYWRFLLLRRRPLNLSSSTNCIVLERRLFLL
jgi:hypothetical protein